MTVYKVPAANFDKLIQRIEKLTRRAKKLGKAVPVLNKLREYDEVINEKLGTLRTYYDVTIEAEPVCVDGFTFVAKIELGDAEVGLVIDRVPGVFSDLDLPAEFRKTTNYCSHCKKSVRRNNVYVIRHNVTGEWSQIGRNCLGQFLGGIDPKDVVANAEMLIDLDGLCSGAQNPDFFGMGEADKLDLVSALTFTAFAIKKLGWLSRSKARELSEQGEYKTATADYITEAYFTQKEYQSEKVKDLLRDYKELSEADKLALEIEAEQAIEWVRSTPEEGRSDYTHNLAVTCSSSSFNKKHMGIVASLLVAHKYATQPKVDKDVKTPSNHFGTLAKRDTFHLLVKDIKFWSNNFGTTQAIFFEDASGNKAIWKSSRQVDVNAGITYEVVGKVKNHSNFKGINQTELSHCKIVGAIGSF